MVEKPCFDSWQEQKIFLFFKAPRLVLGPMAKEWLLQKRLVVIQILCHIHYLFMLLSALSVQKYAYVMFSNVFLQLAQKCRTQTLGNGNRILGGRRLGVTLTSRLSLSTVVKNEQNFTSTTPHASMVYTGATLPSTIVHQARVPITWVPAAWAPPTLPNFIFHAMPQSPKCF